MGGFFTEHSSVPFVFFFLSEYSSIVLFSAFTSILFLGGYNFQDLFVEFIDFNNLIINFFSINFALKTCIFCFIFVLLRATLPRLKYNQLLSLCWLHLLPLAVGLICFLPSFMLGLESLIVL